MRMTRGKHGVNLPSQSPLLPGCNTTMSAPFDPSSLFQNIPRTPMARREIFVSYHHQADQYYYNQFASVFSNTYRVIQDNSLRYGINSDDAEYVMRRIREEYLTGTSCTIVLCGKETHLRKFVDWEIKATLD